MELRYCPVNDCSEGTPIAYRTSVLINSVVLGELRPANYMPHLESDPRGIDFAKWSIEQGMQAINQFVAAMRHIQWLSVKIPTALVLEVDLHRYISQMIEQSNFAYPDKLCLEFSPELLRIDPAKARIAVLDMKLLGVKTMLSDCGAYDFPLTSLINVPVDMVMLSANMTSLANDRDKPSVLNQFLGFIHSLRIDSVCEGVLNDTDLTTLGRADCIGWIPSSEYVGKFSGETDLDFRAALAQKEAQD